ncbi:MAG: tetratricopeptide repeat protein, partial [Ktedonobacteraceae bacterium]|nr:tetratricopeptide repeat protein [Ktedonobacteraceae bacterium]
DSILLLLRQSKLLDRYTSLDNVPTAERTAAERIVKEMDGLPLALVQAGAYVEETGCSLTDYLDLYTTRRKDLLAKRSRLLLDYAETVDTTWLLSFQQIEEQSPAAADVLRLCAFLAADAIPEELLIRGATELEAATSVVITDPFRLIETMEVLRKYSLLRRNGDTHMLSMHRLVQTVLKENMNQETQRAWAERTVRVVNAAFPESDYGAGANHQYYLQYYLPHVQECATLIEQYHLHFPEATHLLFQAGVFLYNYGFYPQSEALNQQALSIREQVLGREHPATAESLNFLAILARNHGNYEQSEALHRQALAIREKTLGSQHFATGESLNNLGVLYRNQGKYERAEPLFQQAFSIRKQTLGSDHSETLTTSINLAKLYLEQRKYERAERLLKQSLTAFERVLDPEHPRIAQNLNLLARLAYEQGEYEQAEVFWKRAIAIIENTLGLENPAIAESLNSLAELFFVQGRSAQAQSYCQRALSVYENAFGSEHPDTISYRQHLARIMSKKEEAG